MFPWDLASANFEIAERHAVRADGVLHRRPADPLSGVRVEPIGTRRLPTINLLHMRAEKTFRLTQGHSVSLRFNVYNVTNISTVQSLTQLSGPNFERPVTIMPPRIAELGVQYDF